MGHLKTDRDFTLFVQKFGGVPILDAKMYTNERRYYTTACS